MKSQSTIALAALVPTMGLLSCATQSDSTTQSQPVATASIPSQITTPRPVQLRLLDELDEFKDSESFAFYGFSPGGPHHKWLERVERERERHEGDFATALSLGELMMLGQSYRQSKGAETSDTRWFRARVLDPMGEDL